MMEVYKLYSIFRECIVYIFRFIVNCEALLPGLTAPIFWLTVIILLASIIWLIVCIAYEKLKVQSLVALQSLINLWVMLISILLLLSLHHDYDNQYPFHRYQRSDDTACSIHSALSVTSLFVPPQSLILLTLVHYRAVFWSRFNSKLEHKHIIGPLLLIWLTLIVIVALWVSFHRDYSNWYCLPYVTSDSFSWAAVILQPLSIIHFLTYFFTFVIFYLKIMFHVRKEEALVKDARSKKISTLRQIIVKFRITCILYLSQMILMLTMMALALSLNNDTLQAVCFAGYVVTVAIADVYLHAYITMKSILRNLCFQAQQ